MQEQIDAMEAGKALANSKLMKNLKNKAAKGKKLSKDEKERLNAMQREEHITQEDILENIKIVIGSWFGKAKIELSESSFESSYSSSEEESSDYSAMAARRKNYREKRKPAHLAN